MIARFCRQCGERLVSGVPADDDRTRSHCPSCGHVEYCNPRVRAGCVFTTIDGRVALRTVLLDPGERLQAGALRAAGAAISEDALVLYVALTDRAAEEVSIVFRSRVALPLLTPDPPSRPVWEHALLARFSAESLSGVPRVHTAEAGGSEPRFSPVECSRQPRAS